MIQKISIYRIWIVVILSIMLVSCKKDKKEETIFYQHSNNSVLVTNEGGYNAANASVSQYIENEELVHNNVFFNVNNKVLGDIAQSMTIHNNTAYIVVNNSQKIEVVNIDDFVSIATIEGFSSPRNLLPLGDGRAYVSNLFSGTIDIIDLTSNTITGNIQLAGSWSESMLIANNKVYVTMADTNFVAVIDPVNDNVLNYINVAKGPVGIVKDNSNKLWVLSDGGWQGIVNPELVRIDPIVDTIVEQHVFSDVTSSPSRLTINPAGTKLFYLNNGVFNFDIGVNTNLNSSALIASTNANSFYGLGINKAGDKLYVGDAIDFVQNGKVYIYNAQTGALVSEFNVGKNPNGFYPL